MAVEDFTTYTLSSNGGTLAVTSTRATATTFPTRTVTTGYAQKDKGAGFFTGDYTHFLTLDLTSIGTDALVCLWMLSNDPGSYYDVAIGGSHPCMVLLYFQTTATLYLRDFRSGSNTDDTWVSGLSASTVYYLTLQRSGTTVTCNIYSDSTRTTLVKALTISPGSATAFQYVAVMTTYNDSGTTGNVSGFVENLDLAASAGGGSPTYPQLERGIRGYCRGLAGMN